MTETNIYRAHLASILVLVEEIEDCLRHGSVKGFTPLKRRLESIERDLDAASRCAASCAGLVPNDGTQLIAPGEIQERTPYEIELGRKIDAMPDPMDKVREQVAAAAARKAELLKGRRERDKASRRAKTAARRDANEQREG